MESSILSEVDDTSILRTGLPRRYACPLNWLPASRLLPRAAGWSAATLCFGTTRLRWPPAGRSAYWGSAAFLWYDVQPRRPDQLDWTQRDPQHRNSTRRQQIIGHETIDSRRDGLRGTDRRAEIWRNDPLPA